METLPIDAVKPGAVLAASVTDARGQVLVGEGKVLTEEWLQRLKGRGVQRLSVQSVSEGAPAAASQAPASGERLERCERMFARAPQDDLMQVLQPLLDAGFGDSASAGTRQPDRAATV